jgi:hypothetical protein
LIPAYATARDGRVILRGTEALINGWCNSYRREKAEEAFEALGVARTGHLERVEPPELKDKGIRFPVETPPDWEEAESLAEFREAIEYMEQGENGDDD